MIKKSVEFLGFKKDFLTALTRDSGAIFKCIYPSNVTEFSDKYSSFIEYLKQSGFENVLAVISIENCTLLQEEQALYKEKLKSTTDPNLLENIHNIPTIILRKNSLLNLANDFPRDKILLLSCDEKCMQVEITENKFAVVNIS